MSGKKRTFAELSQSSATPRRETLTSHLSRITPWWTDARPRSARSVKHVETRTVQPESARGILRRLAKITAPTTRRRVSTPIANKSGKENHTPNKEDVDDDSQLKRPKLSFDIEESLEEEDSELPVAPTPSALLEDGSSEDDQPTETFHNLRRESYMTQRNGLSSSLLPHSEPGLAAEDNDENEKAEGDTTFFTERGRRAVSEEATKMSRYSFGSIHMSGFGPELEIRRESNKLDHFRASTTANKAIDIHDLAENNSLNLGGDTEDLRNLRDSSSSYDEDIGPSFHQGGEETDTFQLDIPNDFGDDIAEHQEIESRGNILRVASASLEIERISVDKHTAKDTSDDGQIQNEHQANTPKARVKRRQKLKINKLGNVVPSIPSSLIRHIVHESCRLSKTRKISLGTDHMTAFEQATEWYFEQVSEDLAAYANHGKRKKRIDESDVLLLMRRQRLLQNDGELRQMAKDWLPSKDLGQLDLPDRP